MHDEVSVKAKIRTGKSRPSLAMKSALEQDRRRRTKKVSSLSFLIGKFGLPALHELLQKYSDKEFLFLPSQKARENWASELYGEKVFLSSLKRYRWVHLDLMRDGEHLDLSDFKKRSKRVGKDMRKVVEFLRAENTGIIVRSLQEYHPGIKKALTELDVLVGAKNVNAYVSLSPGRIFESHWDTHDVIFLQTSGSKKWAVQKGKVDLPLAYYRLLKDENVDRKSKPRVCTLKPGDVLYLPRGYWHKGIGKNSIHLTFGMNKTMTARILARMISDAVIEAFNHVDYRQDMDSIRNTGPLYNKLVRQLVREFRKKMLNDLSVKNFNREVAKLKKKPKLGRPDSLFQF